MPAEVEERLVFNMDDSRNARTSSIQKLLQKRRKMMIIIGVVLVVSVVLAIVVGVMSGKTETQTHGEQSPATYQKLEQLYLETISASNIDAIMKNFSRNTHIAGSIHDYEQAVQTRDAFQAAGFQATIEEYPIFLSYPLTRFVGIVSPPDKVFTCSLKEAVLNDGTSQNGDIPTFNGYSATGSAEGQLVYANYGRREDYAVLDTLNIDLRGKIVICRYGKIFRGNKVYEAEKRGAAGVLIYIDPADTGFVKGSVYTEGPWSNNYTVQRGSVSMIEGDPSTPGWPSTNGGARLNATQVRDPNEIVVPLPRIPVQPLSYGDAEPLLRAIGGHETHPGFQGGLNFTYTIGPSVARVNISITNNDTVTPVWNVVGKIPGNLEPDRYVILGVHRDAWTLGAGDPISGHSVLMETARAFGVLLKAGWKPRRTVILCSWDAEEWAIIGSSEFVEKHLRTLSSNAAVYLNLDIAVKGTDTLNVAGSPSIRSLIDVVTSQVTYKNSPMALKWDKVITPLGMGSDYLAFIHHAGISSLMVEMENHNGFYQSVYHSDYDSYYWYSKFGDVGFEAHASMAQLYGIIALRFADSRVLPFNITEYAVALNGWIGKFNITQVNFTPLVESVARLLVAAGKIDAEVDLANNYDSSITDEILRGINDRLMYFERSFICDDTSVVGKYNWYRHVLFRPSAGDSYSGAAFGTLVDSIDALDYAKADYLVKRISVIIDAAAEYVGGGL